MTDGFDSPVGTLAERCSDVVLPGLWNVGLGYGRYYLLSGQYPSIHTGADIALEPYGGYGQPIYAVADGTVIFSKDVTGTTWRNLVIINHGELCSRYAHLRIRLVRMGDVVRRGQQIGELGNAGGAFAPHLHFDLAPGDTLMRMPTNWPGDDIVTVQKLYVDPIAYIRGHRPMFEDQIIALAEQMKALAIAHKTASPEPPKLTAGYITADSVRGRSGPGLTYPILKLFQTGDEIGFYEESNGWKHALEPIDCWISSQYVSPNA